MTSEPDRDLLGLIREAVPPVTAPPDPGNLWPRLRPRLEPKLPRGGRLDWVLILLALGLLLRFPEVWMLVLYHL